MSIPIMFARLFLADHPKAGQPTFFVEKIWESIYLDYAGAKEFDETKRLGFYVGLHGEFAPKHHTIRGGNRWKAGDVFSPKIWTGKPYRSGQFQFAPDITIKKVIPFKVDKNGVAIINGYYYFPEEEETEVYDYTELAKNDGLSAEDFGEWIIMPCFRKGKAFEGQIICWNDKIEY